VEDAVSDDDRIDLEAWEPQLPPSDFAERVLAQVRAEGKSADAEAGANASANANAKRDARRGARRWRNATGIAGVLALAAALAMRVSSMPDAHGEAIAKDRVEVSMGTRARAVLEPGAQVKWDGDDVVQDRGDVFYRVEPGARFRVHTPVGDVEVKGTCFAVKIRSGSARDGQSGKIEDTDMKMRDVKSGVVGAGLTAFAFVAVYEGKVAVSHASEHVDVGAGEGAQLGAGGVIKNAALGAGEKSFDAKAAANAAADAPLAQANENLVSQVNEYRSRLETIAAQKIELEQQLKKTEEKLAKSADGAAPRSRNEYDLSRDDWAELAKEGRVNYRMPCLESSTLDQSHLDKLGLSPQDVPAIKDAYQQSSDRLWKELRPMCATALGVSNEIADKIGAEQCPHLIYEAAKKADPEAAAEAHTQAAEVRAGLRPEPGPNDKVNPVLKLFLLLTGANKSYEGELAKSFGPDEAHRLAFSDDMCKSTHGWGGGKKRDAGADNK
jgi:ferric-dicitrate binding protein FerR (iron transport regulator)